MAGKAKNTPHFPGVVVGGGGGGVSGVRDMVHPRRAKFFETSLPHFKTYFTPIGRALLSLDNNLKRLISIILLCLQCSLS